MVLHHGLQVYIVFDKVPQSVHCDTLKSVKCGDLWGPKTVWETRMTSLNKRSSFILLDNVQCVNTGNMFD